METNIPLRILFVEDVPADAELAERILRQDGLVFTSTRVETKEEFLRALEEFRPDLIISDYAMPHFDGMAALELALERDAYLPFILLTGSMNEETAVACMKAGAADYVIKEHMQRLSFAVRDALERKKAQLAQAEAEGQILRAKEEWERTFDTVPDLICILDAQHTILRINLRMAEKLGISPSEAVGKTCYECVHGLQSPPNFCPHAQLLKDKQEHTAEFHESRLGGDFLLTCTPWRDRDGQVLGSVHVAHDITERKRDEAARGRLAAIVEGAPAFVGYADAKDGQILYINRGGRAMIGIGADEDLGGIKIPDVHPEWANRLIREVILPTASREGSWLGECAFLNRDGREIPVLMVLQAHRSPGGDLETFSTVSYDITAQKQAEEVLQQQFQRINLLNQIAHGVAQRHDLHNILRVVMECLEEHLPIEFGSVLQYDAALGNFTVGARGSKSGPVAAELGIPEGAVFPAAHTAFLPCLQGEAVYVPDLAEDTEVVPQKLVGRGLRSSVGVPLQVGDEMFGVLAAVRAEVDGFDLEDRRFLEQVAEHVSLALQQTQLQERLQTAYDELRQTQEAVMQQERLRALGQMASGVAHDINNALSPVIGYAQLLQMTEKNLSAEGKQRLSAIEMAGNDISHIVGRMRELYRQRDANEQLVPVDLNVLIPQVVDLTSPRWKDMPQERGVVVDVVTDLAKDLPEVHGIESEIRETLTNLVINAVDAMPEGGTITIRTMLGSPDESVLRIPQSTMVEVTDTGVGMDEKTLNRCLEPFFSTKGERGTGLGMGMAYGVMQRHEGDLQVESSKGQGTTVRLLFPQRGGTETDPNAGLETDVPPHALRVLCIDDDLAVGLLLREMLEADGHTAEVCDGGQAGCEAFASAQQLGEPFDVVISDVGMPQMDGRQVARNIKEQSSTTPVILLTGWGARMRTDGDIPSGVDEVLGKPPRMSDLRRALCRVACAAGAATPTPPAQMSESRVLS